MSDELLPWQKELIETIKESEKDRFKKIMVQARCAGKRQHEMLKRSMESVVHKEGVSMPQHSELNRAMFDPAYKPMKYKTQIYSRGESHIDGVMFSFDESGEIAEIGIPEEFLDEGYYDG